MRVDFGSNADHTGNVAGLGLCARHTAKTSRHKQHTSDFRPLLCQAFAGGIQHGYGGAMHNPLGADIHIRARCHLPVLANTHGIHTFPIVGFRIIRNHHAVSNDYTGGILMRGKQSERMPRIHYEGLLIGHLRKILHSQAVLRPVLEHRPVAAIGDKLIRVLRHCGIEVVLNHHHNRGGLAAFCRI